MTTFFFQFVQNDSYEIKSKENISETFQFRQSMVFIYSSYNSECHISFLSPIALGDTGFPSFAYMCGNI